MKVKQQISYNRKLEYLKITPKGLFLFSIILLICCPFYHVEMMAAYTGDTAIKIKIGLDCIKNHWIKPQEIYSWHQGLNWVPHEVGWYYLVGIAYKLFGLLGVISLSIGFNIAIASCAFVVCSKKVHPVILMLTACAAMLLSFPNRNIRPHLFSELAITLLLYTFLSEKSAKRKVITFWILTLLMAWFHGGMMPVFFALVIAYVAIEFMAHEYKSGLFYLGSILVAFVVSLLSPCGISIWTYGFKVIGPETLNYRNLNMEWFPKTFSLIEILIVLLCLIGFAVDERVRKFDRKTLYRLCIFCMFLIASCIYCRFMNYLALVAILFCGEEIQILFCWINDYVFRIKKEKLKISNFSYYLLSAICLGATLFVSVYGVTHYIKENSMSDINRIAAYDEKVIDCIKENGFSRIYNSFDTGTWLAFYDIPVHIDNRSDPYMEAYSGIDYLTGTMVMNNIDDMDNFVAQYNPDAIVLALDPQVDIVFISDLLISERYKVEYDNTCISNCNANVYYRWMVFKCVYFS